MVTSDNPILIAVAVREELAYLPAALPGVRCLITGMGRRRAASAVDRCLKETPFRLVVSAGFAGATQPGFQVGDLVIASEVVDVVSGLRHRPDQALFVLNGMACVGPLATVERLLESPEAKAKIGAQFGAIAVDLETAAVAEVARLHRVAWAGVRSILDPMEVSVPIGSWGAGVRALLRPSCWRAGMNWMRDIRTAGRSLAGGLEKIGQARLAGGQAQVKESQRDER